MMHLLLGRRHKKHTLQVIDEESKGDVLVLRRSQESRDHLQDLLERSDQKAGFVMTGVAFFGIFLQQGEFLALGIGQLALVCYSLSLLSVCITSWPRKWNWYRAARPDDLYRSHLERTLNQEARASCRQEADLRGIYRTKNLFLALGFALLLAGMFCTELAVQAKY